MLCDWMSCVRIHLGERESERATLLMSNRWHHAYMWVCRCVMNRENNNNNNIRTNEQKHERMNQRKNWSSSCRVCIDVFFGFRCYWWFNPSIPCSIFVIGFIGIINDEMLEFHQNVTLFHFNGSTFISWDNKINNDNNNDRTEEEEEQNLCINWETILNSEDFYSFVLFRWDSISTKIQLIGCFEEKKIEDV